MKPCIRLNCNSNYFCINDNVVEDVEFDFTVEAVWLYNWVSKNIEDRNLEDFVDTYLWDDSSEVYESAKLDGVVKEVFNMENTGILCELKCDDIKNHKQVYVVYDRSGSTWGEETSQFCIDGVEDVFIDDRGRVYTVDKNGSKLTDLDHYIECDGIKVYSL